MPGVMLTGDLLWSSKISVAASQQGKSLAIAYNLDALCEKVAASPQDLVLLDLNTPGLAPAAVLARLRELPNKPQAIVAFGPHVEEQRLVLAAESGCDLVLTNGQFHQNLDQILTKYLT